MDASVWHVEGESGPDLSHAVAAIQEQVLESGAYLRRWEDDEDREWIADELEEMIEFLDLPSEEFRERTERSIQRLRDGGEPETIDHANLWAGPDRTHSILDVRVSDVQELDDAELVELFGSSSPSPDEVSAAVDQLAQYLDRSAAVAFTDSSDRLHIIGVSGD